MTATRPGRSEILIMVVVMLVSAALVWGTLTTGQDWGGDFAQYIMQARSVVEGDPAGFVQQNRPVIEQSTWRMMGPVTYPWGTPVLLAPLYALFGFDIVALKMLNVACFLAWIVLIWLGWSRNHAGLMGTILLMLFAFNPTLIHNTNRVLSDIPFALLSTACILLIGRLVVQRRTFLSPAADRVLLGLLMAASFFVRTNGLLLVAALLLSQGVAGLSGYRRENGWEGLSRLPADVMTRLRRSGLGGAALEALPYLIFAVTVLVWDRFLPEGGASHMGYFVVLTPELLISTIVHYAVAGATFFSGVPLPGLLAAATTPLLIFGARNRLKDDYPLILYGLLTLALYLAWPGRPGLRGLYPLLPIYAHFVLTDLGRIPARLKPARRAVARWVTAGLALAVVGALLVASVKQAATNLADGRQDPDGPYTVAAQEMFAFIRDTTAEEAVIVFRKPRVLWLFTDRRSIRVQWVSALDRGDYLCLQRTKGAHFQISPATAEHLAADGRLAPVFGNAGFSCYRIVPDG